MQLHNHFFSCFLNPSTHFIWAFIAPVIVIILINVGFFIMAAVTIWRHHERKGGDTRTNKHVKSWLKVLVSLVVVMGLTWVSGVPMTFDKWLPLAYIFTIMVAFQGMWIFFFFVLFQEQVRDAYITQFWSTMETLSKRKDNRREKSKHTVSKGKDDGVMTLKNKSAF